MAFKTIAELRQEDARKMALLDSKRKERDLAPTISMDQYAQYFSFGGLQYPFIPTQTLLGNKEDIPASFAGYVQGAYRSNGIVFACILVRLMLFSEARFQWRRFSKDDQPAELWGDDRLLPLEVPEPNKVTGDLLTRMEQDVSIGGNWYGTRWAPPIPRGSDPKDPRFNPRIKRLRPDWVTIILGSPNGPDDAVEEIRSGDIEAEVIGYAFHPGGYHSGRDPQILGVDQVAHYAPIPDPLASYRGMSWITPILRETMGDSAMIAHKLSYLEKGAPQPLDARLATPDGWTSMGDIRVGDRVIGRDGSPCNVIGVYPQGEGEVYRVTFSNGSSAECDARHVWQVQRAGDGDSETRLLTLGQMLSDGLFYGRDQEVAKFRIPLAEPVEYEPAALLPLNPYLLGTLLGDGGFTGKAISLAGSLKDAADTEALVMATVPAGIEMRRRPDVGGAVSWGLTSGAPKPNPVMSVLRALDLQGRSCYAKFIPEPYMRASVGDRIALLQGLLDTDGTVAGSTSFWSTSHVMALQVEELVRSLGGNARCRRTRPNAWRVRISRLPAWIVPFRLPRKVAAYTGGLAPRSPRHTYLVKAEYVGRKPVQCIKVDAADHLYLTDDFVVTHNTVNMVVTLDPEIDPDAFKQWIEIFRTQHEGVMNAYRTLYLAGGAAVTPVGNNFQQMEFAVTQKAGEIRIASAAGVPAIVAGLGGGLEAGTHENFQQARRQMGDMTLRPLWRNACGSLQAIVPPPGGSRLWYDDRDIAFLREDRKDLADIQAVEASAISSLITAGFQPESAVMAIRTNDFSKLVHSGMYSVQLQPPNTLATPIPGLGTGDKGVAKAPAGTVPLTTGQLHPPAAKNGKAPKAS